MYGKHKYYRIISLLLVLVFMLVGCSGGGGGDTASAEEANAGSADNTLNRVLKNKKLVVGVLPDYAPWGYVNSSGDLEGYDADIANELAESLDVEVEIVAIEAPNRVPSLASNKVDVIIACLTPTNERAKSVDFTIPYASAGLIPMVKADNDSIQSYKDLAGKTVAVVRGGTPELGVRAAIPDADIMTFDTIADAYNAFKQGQAEAFVEEDSYVFVEVKNNPEYKAVGETFSTELISIALRQGDQQWLNYLNNFLTNLRFTGRNAELYEKWFGHEPKELIIP
ncbi:MAG: transporter substrate-binding domain-containing protein [Sporomusa sp.]